MTDFGFEISCTDSIKTGHYVSGARLVAEAAYRRLITPRGMLSGGEEEDNYGFDVMDAIGSVSTASEAASLPGRIQTELLKDDRLQSVDVVVTPSTSGPSTTFNIDITGHTAAGPFNLVLAVSSVTVDILGIRPS